METTLSKAANEMMAKILAEPWERPEKKVKTERARAIAEGVARARNITSEDVLAALEAHKTKLAAANALGISTHTLDTKLKMIERTL